MYKVHDLLKIDKNKIIFEVFINLKKNLKSPSFLIFFVVTLQHQISNKLNYKTINSEIHIERERKHMNKLHPSSITLYFSAIEKG